MGDGILPLKVMLVLPKGHLHLGTSPENDVWALCSLQGKPQSVEQGQVERQEINCNAPINKALGDKLLFKR